MSMDRYGFSEPDYEGEYEAHQARQEAEYEAQCRAEEAGFPGEAWTRYNSWDARGVARFALGAFVVHSTDQAGGEPASEAMTAGPEWLSQLFAHADPWHVAAEGDPGELVPGVPEPWALELVTALAAGGPRCTLARSCSTAFEVGGREGLESFGIAFGGRDDGE